MNESDISKQKSETLGRSALMDYKPVRNRAVRLAQGEWNRPTTGGAAFAMVESSWINIDRSTPEWLRVTRIGAASEYGLSAPLHLATL